MKAYENWEKALKKTEIIRPRIQSMMTFSETSMPYILLSESSINMGDTVVRKGEVVVERPTLILPPNIPQFEGFEFVGYVDKVCGKFGHVDLKKVRDANPEKLMWTARDRKFHWQAFLYNVGMNPYNPYRPFNFICVDGNYGVSVIQIPPYKLQLAEKEIIETLQSFRRCALMDDWNKNFDYKSENWFFTLE